MTSIVRLLASARADARLSQRQLSAAADIPQASVSLIERGLISPRTTTVERWLDACGATLQVGRVDSPAAMLRSRTERTTASSRPKPGEQPGRPRRGDDWASWMG